MAERPIKLSSQQDTDPAECVTVKRKQCSDGHSQMVPAALQLQVHTPEPTLEEKLEMVKKMKCEAADIFILMHRISEENDVLIAAEPCVDSLSETEYPRTCEAVLQWLQLLLSFFPSTDIRLESRIVKTLEHLRDNDFLISVFGRFNSGKSTLLNAVLANKCLPVSEQNETMMVVKIAHGRDIHPGCCKSSSCVQMCPLLEESKLLSDSQTMALTDNPTIGAQNICKALKAVDQKVKKKQLKVTSQLTIKAHVPVIAKVQEPWRVFLVDNPGFSADDDGINSLAQTAMETSHAYILTLDYNTIEDKTNAKTFQDIFKKDKSVFDDKHSRLVIAVTRSDVHYQSVDEDEQLSLPMLKEKAVKLVCEEVHKAVGVRISEAKVVPVFGMWALSARQLKYLQDSRSLKQAKKHLEQFFTGPSGEGQDVAADISPDDVVEMLEKESGIRRLEEEIQNMVKVFGSGWIRSVHGDCSCYVKATLTALRDIISLLHTVMMAQDEKYQQSLQHQQNIAHIQQGFGRNLREDSSNPVVEQLTECYLQDVKDVSKSAKDELTAFEKQCRENLVQGHVPTQSFDSDLQQLLIKLKRLIEEQGFKNIYERLEALREDAIEQKASLQNSAKQYCGLGKTSSRYSYLSKKVSEFKSTVSPLATLVGLKSKDIVEQRPNLQEIRRINRDCPVLNTCGFDAKLEDSVRNLSYQPGQSVKNLSFTSALWEKIKRALAWWGALLKEKPDAGTSESLLRTLNTHSQAEGVDSVDENLSVGELEEVIQRIQDEVDEMLYKYFDEIQLEIISFFFNNGYRDYAIHALEDFSKQFTEPAERQDKEMKVMGAVVQELQVDIDVLKTWCQNLTDLQKLLHQQTGVYYQKYFQSSQAELSMASLPESPASADTELLRSPKPDGIKRNFQTLNTTHEILHISDASQQDATAQHSLNVHPGYKGLCVSNHFEALKGRVRIYWTLERRQRKQAVQCSEFQSDFKEDILSSCKAAALRLRSFNEMYPGLLAVFSAYLIQKWEQVDSKRISIALFGHLASGKSMLVNAILTDSVLPIGKTVKTVEVRIRNNSQVHKGQCPGNSDGKTCSQCPVLLKLNGSKLVKQGRGASNIARILHDIDESMEGEAKPIFIIEAYGSLLDAACIPPWKVHLVENAGYTELSSRKETKRFTHEVLAASAYIFTLPYRDRKNNVHYELLGKLIETDESVFRENRITIVITNFEEWYEDHQCPTVQEVKDDICCSIKDKVGACHVPKECLIPVCGEWANTARMLQSMPSEQTEASRQLEQTARRYWRLYKRATGGRDANEQLQSVEIASKLLTASGIKHVEQRVMTMAATCSEDSITVLCSNFNRSLKEAADYLDASFTVIKGFYEEKSSECEEFETCYATIAAHQEQLKAKRNLKHVLKNVQCLKSIEVTLGTGGEPTYRYIYRIDPQKLHDTLSRKEMGMRKCQEVLAQASERDLPSLQKALNMKLNDTTMFQSAWNICYSHSTDVTRILEFMQETAGRVVQAKPPTAALQATKAGQRPENEATPTILNAKEFVERILMSTGSFKISENMRSERSTVDDQFKECVFENFRSHMQIVAQHTLRHMGDYCCTVVENAIRSFEIEFEESLNQRNEEVKMLKSETQKWSSEAQKIKEYRDHLSRLREHLEEKAKECRMQWESMRRKNPCV